MTSTPKIRCAANDCTLNHSRTVIPDAMGFLDESGFRLGSPPNYGWASVGEKSIGRATHGDWCILVDGDRDHRCRGGLTRYSNISFQLPITVSELVPSRGVAVANES
jgi:hypothetical protein